MLNWKAGMALAFLAITGCSDPEGATQAVEAFGFRDVEIGGRAWIGCGKGDDVATKFTAVNANGQRVSGVVCSEWGAWGKSDTVRITGMIGAAARPAQSTVPLMDAALVNRP